MIDEALGEHEVIGRVRRVRERWPIRRVVDERDAEVRLPEPQRDDEQADCRGGDTGRVQERRSPPRARADRGHFGVGDAGLIGRRGVVSRRRHRVTVA